MGVNPAGHAVCRAIRVVVSRKLQHEQPFTEERDFIFARIAVDQLLFADRLHLRELCQLLIRFSLRQ